MITQRNGYLYLETNGRLFEMNIQNKPIGAGAMGVVYQGVDCKTGEKVAIKRIFDKYANIPEIRNRAKQEASLMFRHRNLIEMLGFCENNPNYGPIFIISKFIYGININKYIEHHFQRSQESCVKICNIYMSVLDALEYIHAKNILHLDVKPSNIMVENGRNVRLMDLGIAQVMLDGVGSSTNGVLGTPKYAAPEQLCNTREGNSLQTFSTDIYEAAVTLYELLTGSNPYNGFSIDEIKEKHERLQLPYDNNVPRPVLEVLRKATNPIPLQRYSTIRDFKKALQLALVKPRIDHRYKLLGGLGLIIVFFLIVLLLVMIKNYG